MIKKLTAIVVVLVLASLVHATSEYIHHDLKVTLKPDQQFIRVTDTIHLPGHLIKKKIHFLLHGNLAVISKSKDIKIKRKKGKLKAKFFGINTPSFEIKKKIPIKHYAVRLKGWKKSLKKRILTIEYEGTIHHWELLLS